MTIYDIKTSKSKAVELQEIHDLIRKEIEQYATDIENNPDYAAEALVNYQPILTWLPFVTAIRLYRLGHYTEWRTELEFNNRKTLRVKTNLETTLYSHYFK